jgi:hypothetical protein
MLEKYHIPILSGIASGWDEKTTKTVNVIKNHFCRALIINALDKLVRVLIKLV